MKNKLLSTVIILLLCLCGCTASNSTSERAKVTINIPKDDSVNGYRVSAPVNDGEDFKMPTTIEAGNVSVIGNSSANITNGENQYCGNKNSKVFHKMECGSVSNTKEENKIYMESRREFIKNGYSPCGRCSP